MFLQTYEQFQYPSLRSLAIPSLSLEEAQHVESDLRSYYWIQSKFWNFPHLFFDQVEESDCRVQDMLNLNASSAYCF